MISFLHIQLIYIYIIYELYLYTYTFYVCHCCLYVCLHVLICSYYFKHMVAHGCFQMVSVKRYVFSCYTRGSCIGSMARNANWPLAVEILRLMPKCPDVSYYVRLLQHYSRSNENKSFGIRVLNVGKLCTKKCPCACFVVFVEVVLGCGWQIQFTSHPSLHSRTILGSLASTGLGAPLAT